MIFKLRNRIWRPLGLAPLVIVPLVAVLLCDSRVARAENDPTQQPRKVHAATPRMADSRDDSSSKPHPQSKDSPKTLPSWELASALPGLRVAIGPLISFDENDKRTTFCLDVTAGANIFFHKSGQKGLIMLYPELGYTFEQRGLHLAHLGLGLGTGRLWAGWAYLPRFVIGAEGRHVVLGFRHSLLAAYLAGSIWLELSHQILGRESGLKHDLRVLFGIDVPRVLFLIPHLGRALSR